MNFSEIRTISFAPTSQSLILESKESQKFCYAIRQKEDYLRAAEIFAHYIIS